MLFSFKECGSEYSSLGVMDGCEGLAIYCGGVVMCCEGLILLGDYFFLTKIG